MADRTNDLRNMVFPKIHVGGTNEGGLTKRELFAAMAMQGLVTAAGFNPSEHDHVAGWAVKQADALLTALEVSK